MATGIAGGGAPAQEVTQVTQMPLPPQAYYSLYTDDKVRRGIVPKPPPPPATSDTYQMFGVTFHADDAIIRPLESQGIRRLYPQNFDHRRELKKLNHSVLTNFLDLLEILIQSPESQKRQEKIDDISLLFIHMHHLINEFRPHQARETLRVMMEVQKRQTLETCDRFQKHLEKCVDVIKQALTGLPEQCDSDSKILASTAVYLSKNKEDSPPEPSISSEDKMMCDIIDSM